MNRNDYEIVKKDEDKLNREERRAMKKDGDCWQTPVEYQLDETDASGKIVLEYLKNAADNFNLKGIALTFCGYAASYFVHTPSSRIFELIYNENRTVMEKEYLPLFTLAGNIRICLPKTPSVDGQRLLKIASVLAVGLAPITGWDFKLPEGVGLKIAKTACDTFDYTEKNQKALLFSEDFLNKDDKRVEQGPECDEISAEISAKIIAISLAGTWDYNCSKIEKDFEPFDRYFAKGFLRMSAGFFGIDAPLITVETLLNKTSFLSELNKYKKCISVTDIMNMYVLLLEEDTDYASLPLEVMYSCMGLFGIGFDSKLSKKDVMTLLKFISDEDDYVPSDILQMFMFASVCNELYNLRLQFSNKVSTTGQTETVSIKTNENENKAVEELEERLRKADTDISLKQQAITKRDSRIEKLEEDVLTLKKELVELSKERDALKEELEELLPIEESTVLKEEELDIELVRKELKDYSEHYRLVLVGGHPNIVSKLKRDYPSVLYIDEKSKTTMGDGLIMGCDVLMMKADSMGHPLTFKVRSLAKRGNKQIRYISPVTNREAVERSMLACVKAELEEIQSAAREL